MEYNTFIRDGKKMYRLRKADGCIEFPSFVAMMAYINKSRPTRKPPIDKHTHIV